MEEVGVFIADGTHLYRVVDRWVGDSESGPMVFLEDCDAQTFRWFPLPEVIEMFRVYPDAS